jgi:hypothetical protein
MASLVSLALLSTPFNPIKKAPKVSPSRAVSFYFYTLYSITGGGWLIMAFHGVFLNPNKNP